MGQDRDDHRRILRPLRFVNRHGVGMDQFVEVGIVVVDFSIIDGHLDHLGLFVDGCYPPDVAVIESILDQADDQFQDSFGGLLLEDFCCSLLRKKDLPNVQGLGHQGH
jgi:hypothetical protein